MKNGTTVLAMSAVLAVGTMFGAAIGAGENNSSATAAASAPPSKLVISLTGGKQERQTNTMAFQIAEHAASNGGEVIIYLNADAAYFSNAKMNRSVKLIDGREALPVINDLMSRGVKFYVNDLSFEESKLRPADFNSGMKKINNAEFCDMLGGAVVISY